MDRERFGYRLPRIVRRLEYMLAREGFAPVAVLGAGAIASSFATGASPWTLLAWAAFALAWYVFRERKVVCPPRPSALVSPVSGRVGAVDRCWDPWLNRPSLRVRVQVSPPGVGILWSTTEGKIEDFWTKAAPFEGPPGSPDLDASPNCYAVHVRTDEGEDAVVAMSSRLPISRLKLDLGPGNRAGQGKRLAFGYFISHVDLLIEESGHAEVATGDEVLGGETVLATFPPRSQAP